MKHGTAQPTQSTGRARGGPQGTTRSYLFHGLTLTLAADADILAALHARLGRFPMGIRAGAPHLQFDFLPATGPDCRRLERPAGPGQTIMQLTAGSVEYFAASQQLHVDLAGRGRAWCDLRARQVEIECPAADPERVWICAHLLFTMPLAELLKREGLYMLHAAGVAEAGQGLLLAGASGAGLTTLAIALLRAGFGFLGDDTLFLAPATPPVNGPPAPLQRNAPASVPAALRALAFPDEMDLAPRTFDFFPELARDTSAPPPGQRPKRPVCATRVYGIQPLWECVPAMLVFPQAATSPASVLTPMTKADALLQLLCNVVRTEVHSSQAHLDALAALVRQCRCYRLQTGRDFDTLPARLQSLLQRPGATECP